MASGFEEQGTAIRFRGESGVHVRQRNECGAVAWYVLEAAHSEIALGTFAVLQTVPAILPLPFVGVIIDAPPPRDGARCASRADHPFGTPSHFRRQGQRLARVPDEHPGGGLLALQARRDALIQELVPSGESLHANSFLQVFAWRPFGRLLAERSTAPAGGLVARGLPQLKPSPPHYTIAEHAPGYAGLWRHRRASWPPRVRMAVLGLRLWGAKNVTAPRIASPGNEESRGVFLFERGTLAGHRFTFEAAVCPNPTCECDYITLRCSPDPPEPQTESSGPISIDLDLARRKIANLAELKREPASADLARAIASEIDDERWHQLMLLYEHLKEYWTEHTDWDHFDELCTFFPEGTMAGYREILPYAKRLTFNRGEARWLAVDSYCFNPTCPCREAALYFVLLPETQGQRPREILSVFYDYKNATTHAPEHVNDYQISEQELVASVKQAYTNLDSLLAERHLLLKMLYSRTHVVPREHSKLKIGRNEPCPCGSGKKYKKCCGA